jgi:hypothetical protein
MTHVSFGSECLPRSGDLRLYRGHRQADAKPVAASETETLLDDPVWYSSHLDDQNEERLYLVNVKKLRNPRCPLVMRANG